MSGGGASTINVYSHMGQGAMADPYFKDGPGIVAPKNFYGAPDRAPTYRYDKTYSTIALAL